MNQSPRGPYGFFLIKNMDSTSLTAITFHGCSKAIIKGNNDKWADLGESKASEDSLGCRRHLLLAGKNKSQEYGSVHLFPEIHLAESGKLGSLVKFKIILSLLRVLKKLSLKA
jgi:hypothetical protein